jgi:hypothetical protein
MKYIRKPIVIEAVYFDGSKESCEELLGFMEENEGIADIINNEDGSIEIETMETSYIFPKNSYVVLHNVYHTYMDKESFEKLYQQVEN